MVSFIVRGQTTVTVDGILYLIENGEAVIGRQDKKLSGDIVIPETIPYAGTYIKVSRIVEPTDFTRWSDNTITCEGGAFQETNITSISIPSSITNITSGAFYKCSSLREVVLPENLKYINSGAFAQCTSLSKVNIPDGITSISRSTFCNCKSLHDLALPNNILSIEDGAFKNSGLLSIDIPKSTKYIGEECFALSALNKVIVHYRELTDINCSLIAFSGLSKCELLVPNGTRTLYINEEPWSMFNSIQEYDDGGGDIGQSDKVYITIDNISYILFKDTQTAQINRQNGKLEGDIIIPEFIEYQNQKYSITSIIQPINMVAYSTGFITCTQGAFQDCNLTSIELPSTIKRIPVGSFFNCSNLKKVKLPENLEALEAASFAGCSSLESIEIPESVKDLGSASFGYGYHSYVFGRCLSLKHINIPKNVTVLGSGCFLDSGIESLELHKDIKKIDIYSLQTKNLKSLKLHIQDNRKLECLEASFADVSHCKLYVPLGSRAFYKEFYPWKDFLSIEEFDDGQGIFSPDYKIVHFSSVKYILNPDNTATVARQDKDLEGEIVIVSELQYEGKTYKVRDFVKPSNVISWSTNFITCEGGAFQDCNISSVTLPDCITKLPAGAFYNCINLKYVKLPDKLMQLGAASFANCKSLESIFIPESVNEFGSETRYGFESFVFGNCSALKKINIPKQIKNIPTGCFKNSGLNTFLIPENVNKLEKECFNLPELVYVKINHKDLSSLTYTESIFPSSISNVVLLVPEGSKNIYSNFYPWKNFMAIEEYVDAKDEYQYNAYKTSIEIIVEDENANRQYLKKLPSGSVVESDKYKIFTPSGKILNNLEPPVIEGLEFSKWEALPSYMPSEDISFRAIYKFTSSSVLDNRVDRKVNVKYIYDLNGQKVSSSINDLENGIYIIQREDGTASKIIIRH